jgi:hypothetical protein
MYLKFEHFLGRRSVDFHNFREMMPLKQPAAAAAVTPHSSGAGPSSSCVVAATRD